MRHVFNVADTFKLRGQGLVVATDKRCDELPSWLKLNVGDDIEIRSGDHIIQTKVAGNMFMTSSSPKTLFGFLVPKDVLKEQVAIGSEIWVTESSILDTQ
jgi:hypothetical protein